MNLRLLLLLGALGGCAATKAAFAPDQLAQDDSECGAASTPDNSQAAHGHDRFKWCIDGRGYTK